MRAQAFFPVNSLDDMLLPDEKELEEIGFDVTELENILSDLVPRRAQQE